VTDNNPNPFSGDIDNRDITIGMLKKQLEDANSKIKDYDVRFNSLAQRLSDYEGISKDLDAAKKKAAKTEQLKPKYGASSKLSWDVITDICGYILKGYTVEESAQNLGITTRTIYNWMNKGKTSDNSKDIHYNLFHATEKIRNVLEGRYRDVIEKAALSGDVKSAHLLLRVLKPSKYNVSSGKALEIEETILTETHEVIKENHDTKITVSKIQQLIQRKAINLSIEDEDEDEFFNT
jgi:hypothetical protein